MITLYGVLLFLHILAAGIWFGGEALMFGLRALALRGGDRARTVALIRDTDRLNKLVISPAVGVLLGAGFWLVLEGHWGFDRFFVIFGLAGFAVSSLVSGVVTFPSGKAPPAGRRSARRGFAGGRLADEADSARPARRRRDPHGIVFVMVTKPTL